MSNFTQLLCLQVNFLALYTFIIIVRHHTLRAQTEAAIRPLFYEAQLYPVIRARLLMNN